MKSSLARLFYRCFLPSIAGIGCFCATEGTTLAQQDAALRVGPAEKYVLQQLRSGKEANLNDSFAGKTNQTLNSVFLEMLVSGAYSSGASIDMIKRRGIKIRNAVFDSPVYVSHVDVPYEVWLLGCKFLKGVDFEGSHFARDFSLEGSRFAPTISFINLAVTGDLVFQDATFEGPVDATGSRIGGDLIGDGAKYLNTEMALDLENVRVGESVFLRNAFFQGPVSVSNAYVRDFVLETGGGVLPDLDMSQTVVERGLRLAKTQIRRIQASSIRVLGSAVFEALQIPELLTLRHADFHALEIRDVHPPENPAQFRIDGMSYEHVKAGEGEDSWQTLFQFVDKSHYDSQSYLQLESFFRARGYPERANKVYLAMKRKERSQILPVLSSEWWSSLALDWLVRYGRQPAWALLYSSIVVLAGIFVFWDKNKMEPQKAEDANKYFSSFWYSLDLLTPFIDLQAANVWAPKREWRFGRHYARVHRILGWILVPIGIAAITGIIK